MRVDYEQNLKYGLQEKTFKLYDKMASPTDLAESSQALFCALADYVGIPTINGKFRLNSKSVTINNVFDIDDENNNIYEKFSFNWSKKYPRTSIKSLFEKHVESGKFNVFMKEPTMAKLSTLFMYGWTSGLKTGMYYLRRRPKLEAIQFSLSNNTMPEEKNEDCISCSA
jgi:hypothetical protein